MQHLSLMMNTRGRVLGLALVALVLALPLPSQAAEWRARMAAEQAGLDLVQDAAKQRVDQAFAQAATLARADDAVTQARLVQQKDSMIRSRSALGELRSLSTPDETFFAGCVTRSYLARYEHGAQRWTLKFRRGVAGWYLSDLNVSTF